MNWKQPKVYAVKHKSEETRAASRSGGIFTALSDEVLANAVRDGGKVNLKTLGISEELAWAIFQYLKDCGFIAMCEVQGEIAKAMKTIQVLSLGEKLIEADDEVVKVKLKKSAKAEVGCDKTGPHANLTVEISNA